MPMTWVVDLHFFLKRTLALNRVWGASVASSHGDKAYDGAADRSLQQLRQRDNVTM